MAKFKIGDKVRILDGYKIKNYSGSWCHKSMERYVGEVNVITDLRVHDDGITSYGMEDNCFNWDERGLELVNATLPQKIVITTDGKRTTAVLYDGKKRVDEAAALCSNDDEFDFMTGAKIALERLTEEKEPERDLRELLKNGTFGKDDRWGLFVVVGENLVFEEGGYEKIEDYNANLEAACSNIVEIYGNAPSFRYAESDFCEVIWKRGE